MKKNRYYSSNYLICSKLLKKKAGVAELVDALDLGSSAARRGGSSPFTRTSFQIVLESDCLIF